MQFLCWVQLDASSWYFSSTISGFSHNNTNMRWRLYLCCARGFVVPSLIGSDWLYSERVLQSSVWREAKLFLVLSRVEFLEGAFRKLIDKRIIDEEELTRPLYSLEATSFQLLFSRFPDWRMRWQSASLSSRINVSPNSGTYPELRCTSHSSRTTTRFGPMCSWTKRNDRGASFSLFNEISLELCAYYATSNDEYRYWCSARARPIDHVSSRFASKRYDKSCHSNLCAFWRIFRMLRKFPRCFCPARYSPVHSSVERPTRVGVAKMRFRYLRPNLN